MGLFLIILFICIAYFYSVENHYKWNVIDLSSSNNDLYVNGYIIFNKDTTMVVLDELAYTSEKIGTIDEPKVKSIDISLYFGDDFDVLFCDTEIEALTLENTKIKQYHPFYLFVILIQNKGNYSLL